VYDINVILIITAMKMIEDKGKQPAVFNLEELVIENQAYRQTIWTGDKMQVTVMSIPVGGEIGLEEHHNIEQFIRVDQGQGKVYMGQKSDELTFVEDIEDGYSVHIPAEIFHNIVNTGTEPLQLYSIYAEPEHPFGTVHLTKADADEAHHE
jgi:mannose-6-phosphate isomerase-like protein (cupin superfamily)